MWHPRLSLWLCMYEEGQEVLPDDEPQVQFKDLYLSGRRKVELKKSAKSESQNPPSRKVKIRQVGKSNSAYLAQRVL